MTRKEQTSYFLPKVQLTDKNVMIDGQKMINDQQVKNDLRTYDIIRKNTTGQGDDYTTGRLLGCPYFKEHYKIITTDLSKQQALHPDPKAIKQINFNGNLAQGGQSAMFFIIEEAKETIIDFSRGTMIVL